MKLYRLQFQHEFLDAIRAGRKTATIRPSLQHFGPGDIVGAVIKRFDRFDQARLYVRIVAVSRIAWKSVTDEHLAKTQAPRSWYENRYGDELKPDTELTFIEFEFDKDGEA